MSVWLEIVLPVSFLVTLVTSMSDTVLTTSVLRTKHMVKEGNLTILYNISVQYGN